MAFLDKNGMRLSIIPESVISRAMQIQAQGRAAHHSLNDGDRDIRPKLESGATVRKVSRFASRAYDDAASFYDDARPVIAGLVSLVVAGFGLWAIVRYGAML